MEALYKAYKESDKVAIFLVYVREAHPARRPPASGKTPTSPHDVAQHRDINEKVLAASACMKGLKLTLPIVIDGMDGAAEKAYRGRPAATAIIDLDGKVAFHSRGPRGVQPKQARRVIEQLIDRGGLLEGPSRPWPTTRPASQPATQPATRPRPT